MNLLDETIACLTRQIPGSTRVWREFGLDAGSGRLGAALAARGIDAAPVLAALEALRAVPPGPGRDGAGLPAEALIEHILQHFHARHREQLPRLVRLASRVEQAHREHAHCPRGLADELMVMQQALESHMMKEEQILFPLLARGQRQSCEGLIAVIRAEHDELGLALQRLRQLAGAGRPPQDACDRWRALDEGLARLEDELLRHMQLENDVLFAAAPVGAPRRTTQAREIGQGE